MFCCLVMLFGYEVFCGVFCAVAFHCVFLPYLTQWASTAAPDLTLKTYRINSNPSNLHYLVGRNNEFVTVIATTPKWAFFTVTEVDIQKGRTGSSLGRMVRCRFLLLPLLKASAALGPLITSRGDVDDDASSFVSLAVSIACDGG